MNKEQKKEGNIRDHRVSLMHRSACALAVLMMLIVLIPLPTSAEISDENRETVLIERQYSSPTFNYDGYDRVTINGLNSSRMNDIPYYLPVESIELSIPAGKVSDLQMSYRTSSEVYLGIYALEPLQLSNGLSNASYGIGNQRTEHVNENGFYQRPHDNVFYLSVSPLSYDPNTGEMYYVQSISVTVSYILEKFPSQPKFTAAGDDLLIITSDALKPEFQRLADWKESLGFNVQLVNISTVTGGAPVSAESVKSYINAQHNISEIEYVLLGGDDTIIPAWHVTIDLNMSQEYPSVISDLYYASFNYNVDWRVEVHPFYNLSIGRLPFKEVVQVRNYIDKLIKYESRDYPDNYDEVLFIGQKLQNDPVVWGGDAKDSNLIHIPIEYNITTLYERDLAGDVVGFTKVKAALESGAHIVNDLSHGSFDYLLDITSAKVAQVDNPLPYIWFSQACRVGGFDMNPNIGKTLLADENNAIAMVVNSREGLYSPSDVTQGPSNLFDNAYMELLFDDTLLLGDIVCNSKETLAGEIASSLMLWIYAELNLLGDPTLKVGGYETLLSASLRIDDNVDLHSTASLYGWSGDGSSGNPFIVQGYYLRNNEYRECLYIANTTSHVILQNNSIVQQRTGQNGIVLMNASNITVSNNSFSNKNIGLYVTDSDNITILDNVFSSNVFAIELRDSIHCTVQGNKMVRGNGQGITLVTVNDSNLSGNIISRCTQVGISVNGNAVNVSGNSFYLNNGSDIFSSVPQAFNSGSNDWNGNFWFLFSGLNYSLAGSGADNAALASDPFNSPTFNTFDLDAMQSMDVSPLTQFDFTATSSYGMESYMLSVNDAALALSNPSIRAGDLGLNRGWNNLSMLAFSSAGTVSYYRLTLNYTASGISVNITAPNNYFTSTDKVALRWVSNDAVNVSYYELRIDDGDWLNLSRTTRYTTPPLSQGLHNLQVRAVAYDGGIQVDSRYIFVDTVAPTLFIKDLREGTLLLNNQITINWMVSDDSPSSSISHFTLQIDSSTAVSINDSSTRSYTMPLSEGSHRITLRAYDKAGNYRQVQVNVLVDTEPPSITFIPSADHPYYNKDLQVNWTVSDSSSGIASTHIRINRGAWINVTGRSSYLFPALSDGYYDVELKSLDKAGYLSSAHLATVVAEKQAVLDFINPHNGGYSKSPDVLSWNVWDKRGYTYTYSYSLDGAPFVTLGATSELTLTLENGSHTMLVRAVCVETEAVMERAISFIALKSAQSPFWTDPINAESEFLFDKPMRAGFALAMFIDKDLSKMVLRDSEGLIVPGTSLWSANGVMSFIPIDNLDYPAEYRLSINVVDVAGNVKNSTITFTTKELSLPGAPRNLTFEYNPSWDGISVLLSWNEPVDDGGYPSNLSALQYNVYRRSNSTDFVLLTTVTDLNYEDHSVGWNDYYIYYVTAVNPVGESPATGLVLVPLPEEPDLWAKVGLLFDNAGRILDMFLADAETYLGMIGTELGNYVDVFVTAVSEFLESLGVAIVDGINSLVDSLINALNGLGDAIIFFLESLGQFFIDIVTGLINTDPQDMAATLFAIFLLVILVMLLRMDRDHRKTTSPKEEEKAHYPIPKKAEEKILDLVIPRSINATITEQNGRLIMGDIAELESAYHDGLVGWQDYEMTLAELSSSLSAVTLASYFTQVSEDTY